MNMKRIAPLAMSALLLGGTAAFAQGVAVSPTPPTPSEVSQPQQQQEASYMQVTGKVDKIEQRGDVTYYVNEDEQNPFLVAVKNSENIFDAKGNKTTLKEGDEFTAFVYANQPMILIYPPHYTATALVKKSDEMGTAALGTFNQELVNETNTLKLNVSDDTVIVNEQGEKLAEFTGGDALVFYTISTRSIPAQTTPSKIVTIKQEGVSDVVPSTPTEEAKPSVPATPLEPAMPVEGAAEAKLDALVGTDVKTVKGTKMVPLRLVAEEFGYKVTSNGKGAIVSKDALSYTITRGEKTYGHNRALGQFTEAPALLETNKTYVEYDFALKLVD